MNEEEENDFSHETESNCSLANKMFALASYFFGSNFVWTAVGATILPGFLF
jgi:hypothetical protein